MGSVLCHLVIVFFCPILIDGILEALEDPLHVQQVETLTLACRLQPAEQATQSSGLQVVIVREQQLYATVRL